MSEDETLPTAAECVQQAANRFSDDPRSLSYLVLVQDPESNEIETATNIEMRSLGRLLRQMADHCDARAERDESIPQGEPS